MHLKNKRVTKILVALVFFVLEHKIEPRGAGGGRRDEVWDLETMFSQLAKRSPSVVISG